MEEFKKMRIKKLFEENDEIKKFLEYPTEELLIMRMYFKLRLVLPVRREKDELRVRIITACLATHKYNLLTYMLNLKYNVDVLDASSEYKYNPRMEETICKNCKCTHCIKYEIASLMDLVDEFSNENNVNIEYVDVVDYILNRETPCFKQVPDSRFFEKVKIVELIFVHAILEADLMIMKKYDEQKQTAIFEFLDLSQRKDEYYYINDLIEFFKNQKGNQRVKISVFDFETILKEKDFYKRVYKIAAYYKFMIEVMKVDIIAGLKEMLDSYNETEEIKVRSHYYIHRYFEMIDDLPCPEKTKKKICEIFNYVLNYRYKKVPFVPINIAIYSDDKDIVEMIVKIIENFMWFFGYLPDNARIYDRYVDKILLDNSLLNDLYLNENGKNITGMLLFHNFQNLLSIESVKQNLMLNNIAIDIEKFNRNVCNVIYGKKDELDMLIDKNSKLSQRLINVRLEVDNIEEERIYELLMKNFENTEDMTEEVKEKIQKYVKSTYKQSALKNISYVDNFFNSVILHEYKKFDQNEEINLSIEDIPNVPSFRDLEDIKKDLNNMVGLSTIKEQISDLVSLLKFNKKASISMENFNLHMVFTGDPGTGKTTVARLITEILYNLEYIKQNRLTEVTAKDLIADYVGQTSGKTFRVIKSAVGGVLFIDEAYAISFGNEKGSFGPEAVATIIKAMEDYRNELVIIFAGYKEEMEQFEKVNPGMSSRIGYKIEFPDYTLEELTEIFTKLLDKNNLSITKPALESVKKIIKDSSKVKNFGNARYINNLFQKILVEHAKNQEMGDYKNNLYKINEKDIQYDKLVVKNNGKRIGF